MLTVDTRELGPMEAVRALFEQEGIEVRIELMTYGDYRFDLPNGKVVLVERKTPTDFINSTTASIKNPASRLAKQLNGCMETGADIVVLLIDGPYFPIKGGRIKTTKMQVQHDASVLASKLRTVQRNGIRVEHNMAEWYLPYFLLSMYKNEMREDHTTLALSPKPFSIPSKEEAKWTVLMGIRGVGPKMAQSLIEHFGSVKAISNATHKELEAVKGVGKKMAENIIWYLN